MSITDELRKYGSSFDWYTERPVDVESHFKAIADRIDAEHEKALTEMRDRAYNDGYDEGFASADDVLSREENGMLAEHGWTYLPKGTDGEYWCYGDKLEIGNGLTVDIIGVSGDWLFYATENGFIHRTRAHDKRHYHAPTVEDVLREFAQECLTYATNVDDHEVVDAIAKYAKRLTLAGDAE